MPDIKSRGDALLFSHETTYKTDYNLFNTKPPVFTLYQGKQSAVRSTAHVIKDNHTLRELKYQVPFYMYHERKAILHTSPYEIQQKYSQKNRDLEREVAQKTRPRIVMTPAVSMDDIDDPQARATLVKDMYTTNTSKAQREAVKPYKNIEAALSGLPARPDVMNLAKLKPMYVSPEWRMQSISWDGQQQRACCDPTKKFWLSRDIKIPCRACDEFGIINKHRKIFRQMKFSGH